MVGADLQQSLRRLPVAELVSPVQRRAAHVICRVQLAAASIAQPKELKRRAHAHQRHPSKSARMLRSVLPTRRCRQERGVTACNKCQRRGCWARERWRWGLRTCGAASNRQKDAFGECIVCPTNTVRFGFRCDIRKQRNKAHQSDFVVGNQKQLRNAALRHQLHQLLSPFHCQFD